MLAYLNRDMLILRSAVIMTSEVYFLPSFKLFVLAFINPDLLTLRSEVMRTSEVYFLPSFKCLLS